MSSGRGYIIEFTFERIMQCVKSYGTFIDISEDVGLLYISEINHVHVTSMKVLFALGEENKMNFL